MSEVKHHDAIYIEQVVSDYAGNPLIEALPPIYSRAEAMDKLTYFPEYNPAERELDAHYRLHCIQRLLRYFQPIEKHLEIESKFSRAIRQGYINRNPFSREFTIDLNEGHKIIKNKEYLLDHKSTVSKSSSGLSIIGVSGIGKTTAVKHTLRMYPQVIVHKKYKGERFPFHQITYLRVECPHDGASLKGLCVKFFTRVDEILGSNYNKKFGNTRHSEATMIAQMAQVARSHCIGALIIDEIQNLTTAKRVNSDRMINFFVSLYNEIGIPIVLIGTPSALSVLQKKFREARRGTGDQGTVEWDRMKKDKRWELLIKGMFRYNWTRKDLEFTQELSDVLYDESQGIVDIAVKLFVMAQVNAITSKKEQVTASLIRKVAKTELSLVQPMIKALRTGSLKSFAKYEDIRPVNIQAYIEEAIENAEMEEQMRLHEQAEKQHEKEQVRSLTESLVLGLLDLKFIKPSVAKKEAAKNLGSDAEISDLMKEAVSIALNYDEKPAPKKKPASKKKEPEYSPDDMRLFTEEGKDPETSAYEILKEKGLICDPALEFAM